MVRPPAAGFGQVELIAALAQLAELPSPSPMPEPEAPLAGALSDALLAWIPGARRDLPWRRRRDPYAVWISEVMLQQTQVSTVIPYFERWMRRFPDVRTLAAATLDDVLRIWEGLGYYSRARNLHRAARQIVERQGGQIPANRGELLALPGIGRYTAGAILSLAFGQREPVLDGNVRRLLCRVFDVTGDPRTTATQSVLWGLSRELVESVAAPEAGELNEAMMEIGALVCTPASPDCQACPLAAMCLAHRRGRERDLPARAARREVPHHDVTAAAVQDAGGRYLLIRRPADGLLGGLWGFPGGRADPGETLHACVVRTVREQTGVAVAATSEIIRLNHAYTHLRITLHAYRCELLGGDASPLLCSAVRWVEAAHLASYPFPVTDRKILSRL